MAEVELLRLGTAGAHSAFTRNRRMTRTLLVADDTPSTLRRMIIELATAAGENEADLSGLETVSGIRYSAGPGVIVFDVQNSFSMHSQPYAMCRPFPALEIDDRRFELNEVKT